MSEGELLQIEKARKLDIQEDIYFEVIRQKTASLIAACCACGAASSGASEEQIQKMHLFGEKVGIAFQIKDDLFDFGIDDVGKPLGNDIKEKKMTLPLIYALNQVSKSEKRHIINLVKNHNEDPKKVSEVIQFVRHSGGLDYAKERMLAYQQEAFLFIALMLAIDLGLFTKGDKPVSLKVASIMSAIWVLLALGFYWLIRHFGHELHDIQDLAHLQQVISSHLHDVKIIPGNLEASIEAYNKNLALEFITGYVVEYALSVDNIFVMVLLFTSF